MKKLIKGLGIILGLVILFVGIVYFTNNESIPTGEKGDKAEQLALKIQRAINQKAFDKTEVLEWSFRNKNYYSWYKAAGYVEVSWDGNKVKLYPNDKDKSEILANPDNAFDEELILYAYNNFNNDSFWLVAPYKIMDEGTERSIVTVDGKEQLMVTYTSGGSTPGDSYLWEVDSNFVPVSYKMWVGIIPIGGVAASWNNLKKTEAGILLPTTHTLSLMGMEIPMGEVKAYNPDANAFAEKILKRIKHDKYKTTNTIEWSFGGRRYFKWNKKDHIVDVSWDTIRVNLYPAAREKSTVYFNDKKQETADAKIVKRAWDIFNNDNFWLVAPHKIFDDGVVRSLTSVDGQTALEVNFTQGGTTPGDSYIWVVDSTYLPVKYLMTVPSMRMKQVPATWDEWFTTESGTLLPKNHTFSSGRRLSMGDAKAY
ncbi:MAG: hypothetical protein CMB99_12610 [Flavobacteriaceae bacterium]|nr:hypothetical protein [Flavobacteriaceae bacterium]|tara:strand:- start:11834 stop:13108 length:1275 start_codon:yes stop_codon:yes gene_type:complete